jgi:hypothetical protein
MHHMGQAHACNVHPSIGSRRLPSPSPLPPINEGVDNSGTITRLQAVTRSCSRLLLSGEVHTVVSYGCTADVCCAQLVGLFVGGWAGWVGRDGQPLV